MQLSFPIADERRGTRLMLSGGAIAPPTYLIKLKLEGLTLWV